MTQTVQQVMTANPITVGPDAPLVDAAKAMRDGNVGSVIVTDGAQIQGIVTDRDIVVRGIAHGRDPATTTTGAICSSAVATVSPGDDVDEAVRLMRTHGVRRLPVVDGGKPVGVVAIGDLAVELDRSSALADISAKPPNW